MFKIFVPCISVSSLTMLSHRQAMEKRIAKAEQSNSLVIYCLNKDAASIANASFLLAAYLLLVVGMTAQGAARPFTGPSAPYALAAFRDASFCKQVCLERGCAGSFPTAHYAAPSEVCALAQDFDLTLQDCLAGLAKPVRLGWYDRATFDLARCTFTLPGPDDESFRGARRVSSERSDSPGTCAAVARGQ